MAASGHHIQVRPMAVKPAVRRNPRVRAAGRYSGLSHLFQRCLFSSRLRCFRVEPGELIWQGRIGKTSLRVGVSHAERIVAEGLREQKLSLPFRRYAFGPVWRNEKPGPGRFPVGGRAPGGAAPPLAEGGAVRVVIERRRDPGDLGARRVRRCAARPQAPAGPLSGARGTSTCAARSRHAQPASGHRRRDGAHPQLRPRNR